MFIENTYKKKIKKHYGIINDPTSGSFTQHYIPKYPVQYSYFERNVTIKEFNLLTSHRIENGDRVEIAEVELHTEKPTGKSCKFVAVGHPLKITLKKIG